MPDTNVVENAAAAVPATLTDAVGQHIDQGRECLQEAMSWLTQHGIGFAVNLLMAILILVLGAFVIRWITATVRASLRKSKRVNELLERFICSSRSLVTRASSSTAFDTARCAASMLGRWFIAHAT